MHALRARAPGSASSPASRLSALSFVPFLAILTGCGPVAARLRYVSSQATEASWSFVVDDHARSAELLVDGRERPDCDRAGLTVRCELRGLFPGGHTVELRLPGAVLRRSVVVGRSWPERPVLVRVRSPDEAKEASEAGADGVIADPATALTDLQEIAEAAHVRSARLFVVGDAGAIETAGADGVVGGSALVSAVKNSLDGEGRATKRTVSAVTDLVAELAEGVRAARAEAAAE